MKILFIGDIVGKGGRKAVAKLLPDIQKEFTPDVVIANAENVAHGNGVTKNTLAELYDAGISACTSGNHIWTRDEAIELLEDKKNNLIRPANYPSPHGKGYMILSIGAYSLAVLNLQGQVFLETGVNNPFVEVNRLLAEPEVARANAIFVDFHAEATSEKIAFGWHLDGKVAAVVGTHTHVPTADARLLPQGTGYVSDVGMCGPRDHVLGVEKNVIVPSFVTGRHIRHEIPETGVMMFNAVLVTLNPTTHLATAIARIDREVKIA